MVEEEHIFWINHITIQTRTGRISSSSPNISNTPKPGYVVHSTRVVMKNGDTYCSPIWEWRPKEGYFTIINNEGGSPIRIELANVLKAETLNQRTSATGPSNNEDVLTRAKADGWVGET